MHAVRKTSSRSGHLIKDGGQQNLTETLSNNMRKSLLKKQTKKNTFVNIQFSNEHSVLNTTDRQTKPKCCFIEDHHRCDAVVCTETLMLQR